MPESTPKSKHIDQAKARRDKRKEIETFPAQRKALLERVFSIIREKEGCEVRELTKEERAHDEVRSLLYDLIWLEGDRVPLAEVVAELQYKGLLEK
jgi:hypothetical protein